MKMLKKLAMAGAVAVVALGAGGAGASAYSWSGGAYVGTATAAHTLTLAGAFTLSCPAAQASFSGVATGSDVTHFTPSYGGGTPVCTFFGLPFSVVQSGTWSVRVTSGPVSGVYTGEVHIPAGTSTTMSFPSTGCVVTISGPQTFAGAATMANATPTGVALSANANGIAYTAAGCPFASGMTGQYRTNGNVDIPGVAIS